MIISKILSFVLLSIVSVTIVAHEITITADPAGVIIDNNTYYTVTLDNFHATPDYTSSLIILSPGESSSILRVYQCRASTDHGDIGYSIAPDTRIRSGMPIKVITIYDKEDQEVLHYDEEGDYYYALRSEFNK